MTSSHRGRRAILGHTVLAALFGLGAIPAVLYGADDGAAPSFKIAAPPEATPLTFVVYGDTRFTQRPDVANAPARRALVEKIATERPAAILIGGDLVYEGGNPDDYAVYKSETQEWSQQALKVFPVLGNHELKGCDKNQDPCLESWWQAFSALSLKPQRWYSVSLGPTLLALMLDSDSALKPGSAQRIWFEQQIVAAGTATKFILVMLHYPPVRGPLYPRGRDEREIARYFAHNSKSLHAQVVVVGSHVHNYERYRKNGVTYLVSGGGGAPPVPALHGFGELSKLSTAVNFHYLRFRLEDDRLSGVMVRFDADGRTANPWTEPDHFEVKAKH